MQYSFFDESIRMEKLTKLGDTLEQLNAILSLQIFTPVLERAIPRVDNGKGGRPPIDNLLMFKTLIIKRLYNFAPSLTFSIK